VSMTLEGSGHNSREKRCLTRPLATAAYSV
jgi:hypothetical protein